MALLVGDLGGTRIKAGIIDTRAATVLDQAVFDAHADQTIQTALERLLETWAGLRGFDTATAIGLCLPSIVHQNRVADDRFGKFPGSSKLDIPAWLRDRCGLPSVLENYARAAAIGEWKFGAARGVDDVVMMTLGTGIGTSAIINGMPLRGVNGQAGILGGHIAVGAEGAACVCGNIGCAETIVGSRVLHGQARQLPGFGESALRDVEAIDYAAVFRHADSDELARVLRDRALDIWATLAVTFVHCYDPTCLVIGGGIMRSADVILPHVRSRLARNASTRGNPVKVAAAELGDAAALFGLAHLASQHSPDSTS
ncbi:MAG: ROK family protein [Planctomycetota bacterium]